MKRAAEDVVEAYAPVHAIDIFIGVPLAQCLLVLNEWKTLDAWKRVSHLTLTAVEQVVRARLQPRYEALVAALHAWKSAPSDTPFRFPTPRGPLAMKWIKGNSRAARAAAYPVGADPTEKCMPRPWFVWAISHGLFSTQLFDRVDIPRALEDAEKMTLHGKGSQEPAYNYFKYAGDLLNTDFGTSIDFHAHLGKRWAMAPEHTVPALLSTFTVWRYHGSPNMGEPGNRQCFTKALLKQTWNEDLPGAIAFLLFWAQHMLFQTWVIDETFFQSAIQQLVAELVLEWRGDEEEEKRRALLSEMLSFYRSNFGKSDTLVYK